MKTRIRYLSSLTAFVALFAVTGCNTVSTTSTQYVGGPKFPPSDPANVQILRAEPPRQHVRLGEVRAQPSSTSVDVAKIETAVREKAAKLGADAAVIVVDRVQPVGAMVVGGYLDRSVETIQGRVIVAWPSSIDRGVVLGPPNICHNRYENACPFIPADRVPVRVGHPHANNRSSSRRHSERMAAGARARWRHQHHLPAATRLVELRHPRGPCGRRRPACQRSAGHLRRHSRERADARAGAEQWFSSRAWKLPMPTFLPRRQAGRWVTTLRFPPAAAIPQHVARPDRTNWPSSETRQKGPSFSLRNDPPVIIFATDHLLVPIDGPPIYHDGKSDVERFPTPAPPFAMR